MSEQYNREFLAIDYGTRRIGVAKSDPMGIIASALVTLEVKSQKDALEKILALIDEYNPNAVIFGYPLLRSGDLSDKCREIDKFINKLQERYTGKLYRIDEYASSVEATQIIVAHGQKSGKDKKRIDRLAAVIILERFLEDLK